MVLINLGNQVTAKLEIVSGLNMPNVSQAYLYYDGVNNLNKYTLKIYLGLNSTLGYAWNNDYQAPPSTTWPESYQNL